MSRTILTQPVTVPSQGHYPAKIKQFQVIPCEHDTTKIFVSTPSGFVLNKTQAQSLARLLTQPFKQ